MSERATVVVIGGGVAGLTAARAVRRARADVRVVLLEQEPRVGGKLRLAEVGGVSVDVGAESMLNRRPEGVALAREAGLADRLVHPATIAARIWSRGRMCPMPRSVMGIPADAENLTESGVLSDAGLERALTEPDLPPFRLEPGTDIAVGELVEQRFGTELLDRVVEPLLGGVYAGHARAISARAALPQVVALLDRDSSLMRAAASAVASPASDVPVFAGLVGGLGQLPEALTPGVEVRTGVTVTGLRRSPSGWQVDVHSSAGDDQVPADAVVVATPAPAAAVLLMDAAPAAAAQLGQIEVASVAVVTMAFPAEDFPLVEGSGFLVPPVERRQIKAATYSFAKWDWVREAGHDRDDVVVMRASLGRHREAQQLQHDDAELVRMTLGDLEDAIGLTVPPVDTHVQRWGGSLPQYAVGHLDRVARTRSAVAEVPGLAVCGATYDGVGIPACIASAELAASEVLADLAPEAPPLP